MRILIVVNMLLCATSVAAVQTAGPQAPAAVLVQRPASRAVAAMARRFVHAELLATRRGAVGDSSKALAGQGTQISSSWCIIFFIVIPLALLVFVLTMFWGGDKEETAAEETKHAAAQQTQHSQPVHPMAAPQKAFAASPVRSQLPRPVQAQSPHAASLLASRQGASPTLPRQMPPTSPLASSTLASPFMTQSRVPPGSAPSTGMSAGSGIVNSIWSTGRQQNLPPQLSPSYAPAPGTTTLKVAMGSSLLAQLAKRNTIEVLGAFDYPVAYVRLGTGPEGGRLEIATNPSWAELEVIVGPLDYPANLAHGALIHGPHRELYGPFERTSTGFSVGHYAQAGDVLTATPKKTSGGLVIDINSPSGQQIGAAKAQGENFQIDVGPGVDGFLVISVVLATCIASQFVIDELHTTV